MYIIVLPVIIRGWKVAKILCKENHAVSHLQLGQNVVWKCS